MLHSGKVSNIKNDKSASYEDVMECDVAVTSASDVAVQCDLDEGEDLNKKIIMIEYDLRMRNKEIYKLKEENLKLKQHTFGFHQIRHQMKKSSFSLALQA